jgi:excisionase family DNA binding protein
MKSKNSKGSIETRATKKVYTTGEVARVLGININTVIKWFDEGKMQGFRLPTSNDRRIPLSSLKSFMEENSIPMDLLEEDSPMRRMHRRIPCDNKVQLSVYNGVRLGPFNAQMSNLSQGGLCVSLLGDQSFTVPSKDFVVRVKVVDGPLTGYDLAAKIVHLEPGKDRLNIGLKFNGNDRDQMVRVKSYVESIVN